MDSMFTGIVADVGRVRAVSAAAEGRRLEIETGFDASALDLGASIACNGACLTVIETGPDWFAAEASSETRACTTLGDWQAGRAINLERALRLGDELGGHLVLGHVDGVGRLDGVELVGDSHRLSITAPPELAQFIAVKGSITIDGVSLTVNAVENTRFSVTIVPYTWSHTTLSALSIGDGVNMEADVLARYTARILERGRT